MYVCVYVWVYVCMYVCMYVCKSLFKHGKSSVKLELKTKTNYNCFTEGLWLGAYHELVPVDLNAKGSSMALLRFNLISSFSITNPSLSLLFLRHKHSSGKIKNSKQRPLKKRIHDPRLTDIFAEVGEPSVSQ